jgi:hypothetical protein
MSSKFIFQTASMFALLFLANTRLNAQLHEIPLDLKIRKATMIVEGKVVKSHSYYGHDGTIYTANEVRIDRILKGGSYPEKSATIVTMGGQIDGLEASWTHLLSLQEGDRGIFFLKPTNRPLIDERDFPVQGFDVYSSSQGFLKYAQEKGQTVAVDPFHQYNDIEGQIMVRLKQLTGEEPKVVNHPTMRKVHEGRCIVYSFEPVVERGLLPLRIGADIKVGTTGGSYKFYQGLVVVEYDTLTFGSNVVSNGALEIFDGEISSEAVYSFTATDLAANKLQLKLETVGNIGQLVTIDTQKSFLARVYLNIENPFGSASVIFDNNAMSQGNLYYDQSLSQSEPFGCIRIENEVFPLTCPKITDFFPKTAAAGVGEMSENGIPGVITIVGNNFGEPAPGSVVQKPVNYRVGFRNAGEGGFYVYPPERDYIKWTEDTIVVRVPSLGETGNAAEYAGTGKILVVKFDEPDCFDISEVELYVPFCAMNAALLFTPSNTRKSIPVKLSDVNEEGGYDAWFEDSFLSIDGGDKAFGRAMRTWQCKVHVNFEIKDVTKITNFANACPVSMDTTLPSGVNATTLAVTTISPLQCANGDNTHSYLPFWTMKFNKFYTDSLGNAIEIQWHTDSIPLPPNQNIPPNIDLEGVALHEIGHALLLRHTNNAGNVMRQGTHVRDLTVDDLNGGDHIVKLSIKDPNCSGKMVEYDCTIGAVYNIPKSQFIAYPNPVVDILKVELEVPMSGVFKVFNTIGQQVQAGNLSNFTKDISLDLSGLKNGVYFIHFFDGKENKQLTIKIFKS